MGDKTPEMWEGDPMPEVPDKKDSENEPKKGSGILGALAAGFVGLVALGAIAEALTHPKEKEKDQAKEEPDAVSKGWTGESEKVESQLRCEVDGCGSTNDVKKCTNWGCGHYVCGFHRYWGSCYHCYD